MVVAGELHDEVLPPLLKVHLMGQVLKQDLRAGRLLDLDDDLPGAAIRHPEVAQGAIREVLGDLRRSSLGPGGLTPTIRLLAPTTRVRWLPLDRSSAGTEIGGLEADSAARLPSCEGSLDERL